MKTGRCVRCGRPVVGQGGSICSRCEKNVAQEAARKAKRQARREKGRQPTSSNKFDLTAAAFPIVGAWMYLL